MKNRRNYYRLLQIQPDASTEVVRSSFRALMRESRLHPDLGGSNWNAAVLNEAYSTLGDPKRRAEYDRKLYEQYTKSAILPTSGSKIPLIRRFCFFCKRPFARRAQPDERCPTCATPLRSSGARNRKRAWQRSMTRTNKTVKLSYYSKWPQRAKKATMVDLSPIGMRFHCAERLNPDTVIKISCPILRASAKVTNSNKKVVNKKELYSVGVSFLAVTFEDTIGSFLSATV